MLVLAVKVSDLIMTTDAPKIQMKQIYVNIGRIHLQNGDGCYLKYIRNTATFLSYQTAVRLYVLFF